VFASTVLQISETPWLSDRWGLHDIYVVIDSRKKLLATEPYVLRTLGLSTGPVDSQKMPRSYVQNEIVFALGVTLIELCFGQPLQTFKSPADVDPQGNDHICTEWLIATRMLRELERLEPNKYTEAATRCLLFKFDTMATSLNDPVFQEQFYKGVVTPLSELYDAVK
jgi:hypothetical protein